MNPATHARWIFRPTPRPGYRLRLFCFPYAGAGAAVFRTWGERLPADIEVCGVRPPGRETRLVEPPFPDLAALVEESAAGLEALMEEGPFAFFGHSMGAVLAFELTRRLRRAGRPLPEHLILGGRRGPRVPSRYPPIWQLPDDAFMEAIEERYGGIPDQVAREPELLRLLLPCLKADVAAIEKHPWVEEPPLGMPITVLSGADDPTTLPEEAAAWSQETIGPFALELFAGDHFFLQTAQASVLATVTRALADRRGSPAMARTGS